MLTTVGDGVLDDFMDAEELYRRCKRAIDACVHERDLQALGKQIKVC